MKRVASGILPPSSSYSDQPTRQGFILGFGSTELADIPRTVRKLRSLLP
jgi:DNA-binding transcriptional MocR family regulator